MNKCLLRSFSILMKTAFRADIIKTVLLVLFRKIQTLAVTTQILEKKDKQRIKEVPPRKDSTPVLVNKVVTENIAEKAKEKLGRSYHSYW